ncbi:RNA polymerase sigma-70 factor [Dyadobacter jiangsuensis]
MYFEQIPARTIPSTILKKLSNVPEEELMLLLSESNPNAFTRIYREYQAVVFAYANRITKSRPVAEDISQDVFFKIWEQRKTVGSIRHLKKYLLTMSKHSALDWLARKARDQLMREKMRHGAEEFHCDAENVLQSREYHDLLHNAIEKLPPKRKLIFTLCKINGISYDKVAEQLGVAPGTINDHIVKGTRFVKEYLKQHDMAHTW